MDIERLKEIKRRGLVGKLSPEKQAKFAEIEKRGLLGDVQPAKVVEAPAEVIASEATPAQDIQPMDPRMLQSLQEAGINPEAIQKAYGRTMTQEDVAGLTGAKEQLESTPGFASEFAGELVDPTNVKNALRSGTKTVLDAATLGIAGGFADDVEALVRSGLTNKTREQILEEIRTEYEAMPDSAKNAEMAARIAGSVVGGGAVGKAFGSKLMGHLTSTAGRAAVGGVSAYGESDGDLMSTALGAGLGTVAPGLAKGAGKLVGKGVTATGKGAKEIGKVIPQKVKDNAVYLARHLTTSKTPNTILEIAGDEKLTSKVAQGIDVSKNIATKARPRIVSELRNTPSRVQKSTLKALGVDSVEDLQKVAKKDYKGWFDLNKGKKVNKDLVDEVFNVGDKDLDRIAKTAYVRAVKDNPSLKGLPKNSIAVMQDVKSKLAEEGRKNTANSGYADSLKTQINTYFEELGGDYANVNKNYAKSISKKKIAENMTSLKGRMSRNFAEGLDTFQNYDSLKSEFGEEIADGMQDVLERESGIYKNLQTINKSIDKKLAYKSGAKALKEGLTPRNIAGAAALGVGGAVSAPLALTAGGLGGGAAFGLNQAARSQAGNILEGGLQLNPFVQTILSSQGGSQGAMELQNLLGGNND